MDVYSFIMENMEEGERGVSREALLWVSGMYSEYQNDKKLFSI